MPRTLPWLLDPKPEGRAKSESTPRKRVKRELDSDLDRTPRRPPPPSEKRDFFRSSQSPPTSPARPCPPEEFLIEGLDHDDGWIMVEDEFYAIAQSFTQHLHYAEYVRRKNEVKPQSATTIGKIQRPTDGRTMIPKELQQKKEAEALAARQKAGLEQLAGHDGENEDDDDDDAWAGTHLHGLLTSPRKVRSLAGAHAMKSFTRAAAGFGQATGLNGPTSQTAAGSPLAPLSSTLRAHKAEIDEETEPSEDDDLDGQAYVVTMPATRRAESKAPSTSSATAIPDPEKRGNRVKAATAALEKKHASSVRTSHKPTRVLKSRVQTLFDDLDELPEPARSDTLISANMRRSSTANSTPESVLDDNMIPKTSRHKDVPTFLV